MTLHSLNPAPTLADFEIGKPTAGPSAPPRALPLREQHRGRLEFRLIFAAAFLFFLITSALERALPARWSGPGADTHVRKSVVARAKESAGIVAGYAFMG
jgi:hypothetical protein